MTEQDQDRDLAALLGQVSPRPEPPADVRARILGAVEQEWQAHKRRRWRLPVALAASLLVAAAGALLLTAPVAGTELRVTNDGGLLVDGERYAGDETLRVPRRARLETRGNTRLVSDRGIELRMRGGTRLTWLEPQAVALERGAIYVATGGRGNLSVHTPMGVVRDIGTTFLVTLDDAGLEVAMREGEVAIDTDFGLYQAQARGREGDVVTVGAQRILAAVEPAGADRWQWIHDVHPGYRAGDVATLLGEIANDLGVGLEYASAAARARARTLQLEGDLAGLGPDEALGVVLATTGLSRQPADAGRIIIGIQSATDRQ